MKLFHLACLLLLLAMNGCATIVSDGETSVQFNTVPSSAQCTLKGKNYEQIITTPANLVLPAKASPIVVRCEKDGYSPASETIESTMNGAIIGNLIFGGIIGIGIDLITKSGYDYQETLELVLYKKDFPSLEERNTYFEEQFRLLEEEKSSAEKLLLEKHEEDSSSYKTEMKKIEKNYQSRLQSLENYQSLSIINDGDEKVHTQEEKTLVQ